MPFWMADTSPVCTQSATHSPGNRAQRVAAVTANCLQCMHTRSKLTHSSNHVQGTTSVVRIHR
jgi:hypothetical protein